MNKLIVSLLLLTSISYTSLASASSLPFNKQVFEQLKQQYHGKQWLLVLWSVECPPCFKELQIIQKLSKKYGEVAIVLINTDDNNETAPLRKKVIADYHLAQLPNYYFPEDQATQYRYLIDSTWYGELPRSYFIDQQGLFHGKSGLLKEKTLRKWLIKSKSLI